jgi:hypothetical protein
LIVFERPLDEDDKALFEDDAELDPETAMTNSGSPRRACAAEGSLLTGDRESRLQIKRTARSNQARIHAAESLEDTAEFAARLAPHRKARARGARALSATLQGEASSRDGSNI